MQLSVLYIPKKSQRLLIEQVYQLFSQYILKNNLVSSHQKSLKPFAGKETGPGENIQTDELFEEYIRSKAETAYHPSCTLKMGVDDMAVVDEKLKVHGLENIRVVDASVMPEITSGNLNAPTLMIAERASNFILNS